MRSHATALFILITCMAVAGCYYQYPSILHLMPQGSHIWRQADCMAMTENYSQFHLTFFQPETYNLQSLNGKVAGEFPLLYFFASKFLHPKFALRLIHTLIFLSGIIATYFIAFYFFRRRFLSIICSLMMFTSPLLVFYGNNFLSDVPALSFAFMGWAFFLYSYQTKKKLLLAAFICFTFSALLKASEVFNIIMVIIFLFAIRFPQQKIKSILFLSVGSVALVSCWYFYATQYNLRNHDTYYFLRMAPVWKLSFHDIGLGMWRMTVSWSKNYFWRPTSVILILSTYYLLRYHKKLNTDLRSLVIISFTLTVLYIIIFYQKMIGHEYYYTSFFIFALFYLIASLKLYNYFYAENVFSHTALVFFLLANIIYCKQFTTEKLSDNLYNVNLASTGMQNFLKQNGAGEHKTVLSIPDDSPNKTLYLLKRKGYTDFNDAEKVLKNKLADFLVVSNESLRKDESIKPYLKDSLGNYKGIYLYRLKKD